MTVLRVRQKLGKYRIERRLAQGGFATVYQAHDTIEGIAVALKIPHPQLMTPEALDDFRREVRLTAQLDHPNIVSIKNADFIGDHFVISYPLGERTLAERLRRRMASKTALDLAEQMLAALACAHRQRIIHCDVKPDNLVLFHGGQLRLMDFGIAKVALRTIHASGSGTVGYVAPEQAMGKPTLRSDVFSAGLVIYRMLAGELPEWPYHWPPPGYDRLRRRVHDRFIAFLRRSISVDPARRFEDADQMLNVFRRLRSRALTRRRRRPKNNTGRHWQEVRRRQFLQRYGKGLEMRGECSRCGGPVSEPMQWCCWCGAQRRGQRGNSRFVGHCPRCHRGLKRDWRFCPWCFGSAVQPRSERFYSDVRYAARCSNPECSHKVLMPFMRYCPWCRTKVRRQWRVDGSPDNCPACGWGVVAEYWSHCPWCGIGFEAR